MEMILLSEIDKITFQIGVYILDSSEICAVKGSIGTLHCLCKSILKKNSNETPPKSFASLSIKHYLSNGVVFHF